MGLFFLELNNKHPSILCKTNQKFLLQVLNWTGIWTQRTLDCFKNRIFEYTIHGQCLPCETRFSPSTLLHLWDLILFRSSLFSCYPNFPLQRQCRAAFYPYLCICFHAPSLGYWRRKTHFYALRVLLEVIWRWYSRILSAVFSFSTWLWVQSDHREYSLSPFQQSSVPHFPRP